MVTLNTYDPSSQENQSYCNNFNKDSEIYCQYDKILLFVHFNCEVFNFEVCLG